MSGFKRCGRCRQDLPVTEFYRNRKAKDGLQYACKACTKAYADNPGPPRRRLIREYDVGGELAAKQCSRCDTVKPVDEFSAMSSAGDGLQPACRACSRSYSKAYHADPEKREDYLAKKRLRYEANAEEIRAKARESYRANPERFALASRRHLMKKKYGLTLEDFDRMVADQDSKCAICRSVFDGRPHVDHCHSTGGMRELLCSRCNLAIGQFEDDPDLLRSAAGYVEFWADVYATTEAVDGVA